MLKSGLCAEKYGTSGVPFWAAGFFLFEERIFKKYEGTDGRRKKRMEGLPQMMFFAR